MSFAVEVRGLTKRFVQNRDAHRRYAIRDLLSETFARKRANQPLRPDEFLAVDDLSFQVRPGEAMALVGRNGCGKTTTLKMIAGLLKPDAGRILVRGRVQPLIALGAGFNKKLSGRDNILIAAAVMGMNRREATAISGEIIEFAELGEFIGSPVETYSSGMYARLGFSVACHLDPDVLLIDEILGVGDVGFQRKCFERMNMLQKRGVTVLLVSHAKASVLQMCSQAIWMHEGRMMGFGPAEDVMQNYMDWIDQQDAGKLKETAGALTPSTRRSRESSLYGAIHPPAGIDGPPVLTIRVGGVPRSTIRTHETVEIEWKLNLAQQCSNLNVTLAIYTKSGRKVSVISTLNGDLLSGAVSRCATCRVTIEDFNLNPDTYILVMPVHEGHTYLYRDVVAEFTVASPGHMTWGDIDLRSTYEVLELS